MTSITCDPCTTNSSLSIIVNGGLLAVRDDCSRCLDGAEEWLNDIILRGGAARGVKDHCEVCGARDGMEWHHIAGRKHDPRSITACRECHSKLSKWQREWGNGWEKYDRTFEVRRAFFLMGLRDILKLKARKTSNSIYDAMAESYTEDINRLLRGD